MLSVSCHRVARTRWPSVSRRFSRAAGSRLASAVTNSPTRCGPNSNRWAARSAESQADSAAGCGPSTARSTTPLCDSSHRPDWNGAAAVSSAGIPAVAERTAASTPPPGITRATGAQDAAPHSGPGEPPRAGAPPGPPADPPRPGAPPPGRPPPGRQAPRRSALGVPRKSQAGKDLPPDRGVPVPERGPDGGRGPRPRPAAEHLVVPAEERLAVVAVDHRDEAGPRGEVRRGPLPHVTDPLLGAVGRPAPRAGPDRSPPQAQPAQVGQVRGGPRPAPPPRAPRPPPAAPGAPPLPTH